MKTRQNQGVIMIGKSLLIADFIFTAGLFIVGCSQVQQPPTEEMVISAINDHSDPMDAIGNDFEVTREVVEVINIGEFNKKGKYWPVEVKIRTHKIRRNAMPDEISRTEDDEQISTLPIAKDSNGKWEVKEQE